MHSNFIKKKKECIVISSSWQNIYLRLIYQVTIPNSGHQCEHGVYIRITYGMFTLFGFLDNEGNAPRILDHHHREWRFLPFLHPNWGYSPSRMESYNYDTYLNKKMNNEWNHAVIVLTTIDSLTLCRRTSASSHPSELPWKGSNQNAQASWQVFRQFLKHSRHCLHGIFLMGCGSGFQLVSELQWVRLLCPGFQNHKNDHKIRQAADKQNTLIIKLQQFNDTLVICLKKKNRSICQSANVWNQGMNLWSWHF